MEKKDLIQYERDGFFILKKLIKKKDCLHFKHKVIKPILKKNGISLTNKKTWKNKDGECILSDDGGDHPIGINNPYNRWNKIFDSPKLLAVLDQIHGGSKKWNWLHGAEIGLGWIHLRFQNSKSKEWVPPEVGWHLDGSNGDKVDPKQSVILLPLITLIRSGGGGTAILKGSHKLINDWLHQSKNKRQHLDDFILQQVKKNGKNIIEATGQAGDILIMHPHLVHSSSNALENHPVRITFNLATKTI